jgi:acetyltransferase-like isoleucine patch superfamily enzyme
MTQQISIHPTAEVQSGNIGDGTRIWQYTIILGGATIGTDVNICSHCFVENDVFVGDRVTIKSGVQLWDGIRLEDDVFIGPNVTFTNDRFPRSKVYPERFAETRVERGASVGAGAVLLPGLTIGMRAMVGAGAVVTRSVPPYAIVTGSPARIVGYVDSRATGDEERPAAQPALPNVPGSVALGVGGATLHRLKLVRDLRGDLSAGEFPD